MLSLLFLFVCCSGSANYQVAPLIVCSSILRDTFELTHTHGLSCFVSFLISEARIGRVRGIEGNLHAYIKNTTIILLVWQACCPWVCRVCHGTPRFWQFSEPYFNLLLTNRGNFHMYIVKVKNHYWSSKFWCETLDNQKMKRYRQVKPQIISFLQCRALLAVHRWLFFRVLHFHFIPTSSLCFNVCIK